MEGLELFVTVAPLLDAANKMNRALEIYLKSIDKVKAAAVALAENWEGDGQVQFVKDQDQAYKWYSNLVAVVREMIAAARKVAENYKETEQTLKSMM